jgi:hypothetical protein
MWKIRHRTKTNRHSGEPVFWSEEYGWTWEAFADVYTDSQKEITLLPPGGMWVLTNLD